jgi:hypothetical protein
MLIEKYEFRNSPLVIWGMYIKDVDLSQHCKKCFIGKNIPGLYKPRLDGSNENLHVENISLLPNQPFYYICSVSRKWINSRYRSQLLRYNTHLAFEYCQGEVIEKESDTEYLRITDAKEIPILQEYIPYHQPNPIFRECRNWQFGHYVYKKLYGKPYDPHFLKKEDFLF